MRKTYDALALAAEVQSILLIADNACDVCLEALQTAGAVGAPEAVLDNLSAAAAGDPLPHKTFLPINPDDFHEIRILRDQLAVIGKRDSEKLIAQLRQDLINERRMWKSAIALVLENPANLHLVGNPGTEDEVREALRPVADAVTATGIHWK